MLEMGRPVARFSTMISRRQWQSDKRMPQCTSVVAETGSQGRSAIGPREKACTVVGSPARMIISSPHSVFWAFKNVWQLFALPLPKSTLRR